MSLARAREMLVAVLPVVRFLYLGLTLWSWTHYTILPNLSFFMTLGGAFFLFFFSFLFLWRREKLILISGSVRATHIYSTLESLWSCGPHFPHLVRYHWAPGLNAGFVGEHSHLSTSGLAASFPLYWILNWLHLIIAWSMVRALFPSFQCMNIAQLSFGFSAKWLFWKMFCGFFYGLSDVLLLKYK